MNHPTRHIRNEKGSYAITIPKDIMINSRWQLGEKIAFMPSKDGVVLQKEGLITNAVYSIGYEGKTIDGFLDKLIAKDVELVIDVRENAISRKNGFSKKALEKSLNVNDIQYINIKELGAPKSIRNLLKNGGKFEHFIKMYKQHLNENLDAYTQLKSLCADRTSAIVCFEKYYFECHRRAITSKLQNDDFNVVHI